MIEILSSRRASLIAFAVAWAACGTSPPLPRWIAASASVAALAVASVGLASVFARQRKDGPNVLP